MSKIDIAIKVTSDGAGEPHAVIGGEWMQNVIDIHPILENFIGLNEEGQVARILSFTNGGCILTLARLVAGRGGDNVAAWIFIPANADVTGSEVMYVAIQTEKVIASSEFNLELLRELCNKEYPEKPSLSLAPTGNRMAFRWYNSTNIDDLLGPNRYQPYYDKYRYILLLDENGHVGLKKDIDIDDLTQRHMEAPSMFLHYSANELRNHFGQDISITFIDGKPFDHPVAVKKGERILVRFVRNGFCPVDCYITKTDNLPLVRWPLPDPRQIIWKKAIDQSYFKFSDDQGRDLPNDTNPTVIINGRRLGNVPVEIAEPNLRQVKVDVSVKGQDYAPTSLYVDLTQPAPVNISLIRRTRNWTRKVRMRNGEIADMTLVSKHIPNNKKGPLKGYDYELDTGNLVYDTYRIWIHRTQGLFAGLMIALLCWGISDIISSGNGEQTKVATTDYSNQQDKSTCESPDCQQLDDNEAIKGDTTDTTVNQSLSDLDEEFSEKDAIDYLDKNKYWNRDEMENYQSLRGLFDDLNNFNLEKICSFWKDKLKESTNFKDVADHAESVKAKDINPALPPHDPTYNYKEGDVVINRQNYINWLYNLVNPPKTKANQSATGNSQGSSTGQGSENKSW